MNNKLTVLMYHYVRPIVGSQHPSIRGLELADFEGQIDYIDRHYNVVSVSDVVEATNGGCPLPTNPLLLSFDDGYSDHYRYVLPVLKRRKKKGVFFPPACAVSERKMLDVNKIHFLLANSSDHESLVSQIERAIDSARSEFDLFSLKEYREQLWKTSRYDTAEDIYIKRMLQHALPERLRSCIADELFRRYVTEDESGFADELYMSEENLAEMLAQGMEIGSHGYAHYWLSSLSPVDQAKDIDRSLDMLERIGVSRQGFYFSYPYGDYTHETLGVLNDKNCAVAFTTKVALARLDSSNLFELPRLDTNDLPKSGLAPQAFWTQDALV
ncbi:MAG: polysaccharide deacetylase family protein [Sulfuricella sp.]|nr:polysaccharide deacetylase family protein [Sulfuricella sp.]